MQARPGSGNTSENQGELNTSPGYTGVKKQTGIFEKRKPYRFHIIIEKKGGLGKRC